MLAAEATLRRRRRAGHAGRRRLSFDALQMRLHPAESRIRKLARETPARLILFDMPRRSARSVLDASR